MSSDSDARPSKPLPHVLTSASGSSSAALNASMRGRVEEFGRKMREEHALRGELAKVMCVAAVSATCDA
jgi:hypothetical protein